MPSFPTVTSAALLLLGGIIAAYWYRALRMAAKARRRTGRAANLVPPERLGRALRLLWAPAVLVWVAHPIASALIKHPPAPLRPLWPPGGDGGVVAYGLVRAALAWAAAVVAAACFAATVACWRRMGKSWRMGIDPGETTPLIAAGPFAFVRHPIYALSAGMMIATAVAVPSPLMLAAAIVHVCLLFWESTREERHLLRVHGSAYEQYRARVGRFLPAAVFSPTRSSRNGLG